MTPRHSASLLEDLAKLLKKHGPAAFDRLAAQLTEPQFVEHLAEVLRGVAVAARTQRRIGRGARRAKRTTDDARERQELTATEDPYKARIVKGILDRLHDPAYFPRLQDIRDFAERLGFRDLESTKREQLLRALERELSGFSAEYLNEVLVRLGKPSGANDLSAWSELIISKGDRR